MSFIAQMDPGAFYRAHSTDIDAAVARVLASGWYILGREVAEFERDFAAVIGVPHGIGVANGTDALVLAQRGLGIQPGDKVAAVSHTAVATVAAIELAGGVPVLIDIEEASYTLDPAALEAAFEVHPTIKAVVAVHLYGQAADLQTIEPIVRKHGAWLIEDCAQCHGAMLNGRTLGSIGDAAAFSFYPTKNLGALGDGGFVCTTDAAVAERVRSLREYGWKSRYVSDIAGMNSRLDELQAAILSARLPHLAAENNRRREIAAAYNHGLAGTGLGLPSVRPGATHVYHQYVVRHPDRDALQARMKAEGVGSNIHYPVPVHLQPAYRDRITIGPAGLGRTEAAGRSVLSLPMYPQLDDASVARVIETLRAVV
jgi:dTDP-4-amino-4,6-dideoxygalactose transaminase